MGLHQAGREGSSYVPNTEHGPRCWSDVTIRIIRHIRIMAEEASRSANAGPNSRTSGKIWGRVHMVLRWTVLTIMVTTLRAIASGLHTHSRTRTEDDGDDHDHHR